MFGFPQILLGALLLASLIFNFLRWGQPRQVSFPATAAGTAVILALLIWGGFFS